MKYTVKMIDGPHACAEFAKVNNTPQRLTVIQYHGDSKDIKFKSLYLLDRKENGFAYYRFAENV